MRRAGQEINVRFLRGGVLEQFKAGYEKGVTEREWMQVQGTEMWTAKDKSGREEEVPLDEAKIQQFWLKRVKELRDTEVPVEPWHHELMAIYLKQIKEENLLDQYQISAAAESQNWNGRRRIIVMMTPNQKTEGQRDMLFDFKPVFTVYY